MYYKMVEKNVFLVVKFVIYFVTFSICWNTILLLCFIRKNNVNGGGAGLFCSPGNFVLIYLAFLLCT
jgi:hypothetical protein